MRVRTLEIRWHDSKPISTCDFQPVAFKKARPAHEKGFAGQAYRLASGGEDNHVRLWMVHPNIMPQSVLQSASTSATGAMPTPRAPRVEYLATLSRHSAAVNVVRFSPNGEFIASAGDDGMVIVWAPSNSPHATSYGSDLSAEELQYEKEHWKPRTVFRCTTMQVYDLAWSPNGEYIIAGSTDNCARIFTSTDGKCVHEIAEHSHYVQGVAWDPLNEYVATQSSDRSMHIYSISTKSGSLEVHAVGKNTRMPHRHGRTSSSHSRSRPFRRESTASETESVITTASERLGDETSASGSGSNHYGGALLTPTASVPSTPSGSMFPPPSLERSSSRRSSFSGSQAAASPRMNAHTGRSPSPMPALPAIRPSPAAIWRSLKLYGDESYTNFFRRLTFSPDGGLLLTPAGQFEDPAVIPGVSKPPNGNGKTETRGRKGNPTPIVEDNSDAGASSVYIYSRANFARPPIARLPGHKKPSVAVRFSPFLYELRPGVVAASEFEPPTIMVEKGKDTTVAVDLGGASATAETLQAREMRSPEAPVKESQTPSKSMLGIAAPSPRIAIPVGPAEMMMPSPALSATDSLKPLTPLQSKPGTPAPLQPPPASASVFALQYRMLYAVATMDTVTIYDTQQAGPVCLLTKLHYDEFTDMSWSPDGQSLMISSRDGYCTLVVFDEILATHHTQQNTLQLQSLAHQHSLPLTSSTAATPLSTPSHTVTALPTVSPALTPVVGVKRRAESQPDAPLTPAPSMASMDDTPGGSRIAVEDSVTSASEAAAKEAQQPPKKKRRAALTKVSDIGS